MTKKKSNEDKGYKNPMSMKEHWVLDVSKSVFPKGDPNSPSKDVLPMPGKERPQPHVKINECDH